MTIIYLMRHSEPLNVDYINTFDDIQVQNEKKILSVLGEDLAKKVSCSDVFANIDCVYSSNYVRAMSTAKYVADKNNLKINIVDDLGERKFGVLSYDEIPNDFVRRQFFDDNYKIGIGESQSEVRNRVYSSIVDILNSNRDKKSVVVSHSTAMSYLFKMLCVVSIVNDNIKYVFNDKAFFEGNFDYCETFKLCFDDNNNLIDICNVNVKD